MKRKEERLATGVRAVRRVFVNQKGRPRAVWLLALGYALYLGWAYAASYGLARGFSALFEAWGLTQANLHLAPAWARFVARYYGSGISVVSSRGIIGITCQLMRLMPREQARPRPRWGAFGGGVLTGLGIAVLFAVLFTLTDSVRAARALSQSRLSREMVVLLVVYFFASLAEECFDRAFVLGVVADSLPSWRGRTPAACAVSALMLWLTTGALNLGAIGSLNVLLFGGLCALLHLYGQAAFSLGLRFAWSWATASLVAFPGGNTATAPLMAFYHVSDALMTGGNRGLICGLGMTVMLGLLFFIVWRRAKNTHQGG